MASLHIHTSANGYTAIYGSELNQMVTSVAPAFEPTAHRSLHITLLTKTEAQDLASRSIPNPFRDLPIELKQIVALGLAHDNEGRASLLVLLPSFALLRSKTGLPGKDFHISLSDVEASSHALSTLDHDPCDATPPPSVYLFDALALHHRTRSDLFISQSVAFRGLKIYPTSGELWIRLGDASFRLRQFKLGMLAFGRSYSLSSDSKVQNYAIKQTLGCSRETEWGRTFTESEKGEVELLEGIEGAWDEWSEGLKDELTSKAEEGDRPTLCLDSRERIWVRRGGEDQKLMRFFRWIVPFNLAVSSTPRHALDIQLLASNGVRHVLTLTKESPLPSAWFEGTSVRHTHLPIENMRSPSVEEIEIFIRLATSEESSPLLVHCGGGKGRAGTMIAAYLVVFGFARPPPEPWQYPAMSSSDAISHLRLIRPGSIESTDQEEGVRRWAKHISKRGSPLPNDEVEPDDKFAHIVGSIDKADLIILCGLPGSGKSWFRQALLARSPTWTTVCGDDDGTAAVLTAASHQQKGSRLLIDRCNPTPQHRRELLDLAHLALHPIAIHFDASPELCTQRAQRRSDHPSLPPGSRVRAAIKQFAASLVAPTLKEGFEGVVTVSSFAASQGLVRRLSPPIGLLKFPRTAHLFDLGSATSDDLLHSSTAFVTMPAAHQFVVTEKVDGANLGISLDVNRKIVVQNRSHWVTPNDHAQFKQLDLWVERHREELDRVLARDESFLERYILYGEWMAATHSVSYLRLPDLFIAFDLYDRATGTFHDRNRLNAALDNTSISTTPILYSGPALCKSNLIAMIERQSQFAGEGVRMEGVYVKIEGNGKVLERGKVVRGDFIAGNEHWSKGWIKYNEVVRHEEE